MAFDLTNTGAGVQNTTQDFGETIFGFSYTNVFGAKMTNVFGLAWNYYLLYTKFITGLDLTLDFGWKIEMFYAKTYKIGYADTVDFGVVKSTDLTKYRFGVAETRDQAAGTANTAITTDNTVVVTRNESIEDHNLEVGIANREAEAVNDIIEGILDQVVGAFNLVADEDIDLAALNVSINGLFNVNDGAIEVVI